MSENNVTQSPVENQVESSEVESSEGDLGSNGLEANEVAENIELAQQAGQITKTEAKKMLRKLQIKFNGKEMEEELPFEIPDTDEAKAYMSNHLQLSKLSQSKARAQAALEKEVSMLVEQLRKNPKEVLRDPTIAVDLKKLAAEIIEEEMENSKKSPEQLKLEKAESELKRIKDEREKEKSEYRERELTKLKQQQFEQYDVQVTQALEKAQLPKTARTIKLMADYMIEGVKNNIKITPFEAVNLVKEEFMDELKEMFAHTPEEAIEALIGKDVIKRIRKKDLAKIKSANVPNVPLSKGVRDIGKLVNDKADKDESEKKISFKDFFKV